MGWVDRFVHDPIDAVTDNKFTSSPQGILAGLGIAVGAGAFLSGGLDSILGTAGATGTSAVDDGIGSLAGLGSTDATGSILTGGTTAGVADAAGPGFTFDLEGNAIANDVASQIIPEQQAGGAVKGWADSLASGGLSPAQTTQIQNAAAATGWSPSDIMNALKTGGGALSSLTNALGAYGQYNAAKGAGQAIGQAATKAGDILAGASKEAAGLQSAASTEAASTLASASTAGGQQLSAADLQSSQMLGNAYASSGWNLSEAQKSAANTLAGGYQQAGAAQVAGIGGAIDTAREILTEQRANQKPYMEAGTQALSQLTAGLQAGGQFNRPFTMADAQNTEAYKFALGEGENAINRNAALGGTQLSSANLESLNKYAQGTAAQYEQQAFNQWMSQNNLTLGGLQNLVQTGQVSTDQLQQALGQAGVSIETLQQNLGNANAQAALGSSQALAQGQLGSANALASGDIASAGAYGKGITDSAGHLVAGNLGAAQATAAGQVGSAGYTASGITGAAQAQAAGLVGATNAQQAGNVSAQNIKGQGISNIGNILTQSGAMQYLMGGGTPQTQAGR